MARVKAEVPIWKSGAGSKGRGRKSRDDAGAPGATAITENDWPEAEERLMEEITSRGNMMKAMNRVISNKGSAASMG